MQPGGGLENGLQVRRQFIPSLSAMFFASFGSSTILPTLPVKSMATRDRTDSCERDTLFYNFGSPRNGRRGQSHETASDPSRNVAFSSCNEKERARVNASRGDYRAGKVGERAEHGSRQAGKDRVRAREQRRFEERLKKRREKSQDEEGMITPDACC